MLGIFKVNTEKFKTDLTELEIIGLRVTAHNYINENWCDYCGESEDENGHSFQYATAYTSSSGFAMLNFMDDPIIVIDGVHYEVSYACVLGTDRVVLGAYKCNEETGELEDETYYISN